MFNEACAGEHQRGVSSYKWLFLLLLARLAWKQLQIGTDMLLIITSTNDELLNGVIIDDLE